MAQARKAPLRPASAVKPKAAKSKAAKPAVAQSAKQAAAISATPNATQAGLRMTLWLLLLALLTGAIPLVLAGQALGYWRLPLAAPALPFRPGSLTYDAPLAKAQPMVANTTIHVVSAPGAHATLATLEPGFPVQVTRYATLNSARWAQIHWAGPTKAAGGSGWALATQLRKPPVSGSKGLGDLGALSQTVAKGASEAGPGFSASLYFPASGYIYRTASASQTFILGPQIIPIVLAADFGMGLAAQQPSSIPQNLASGDAGALTFVYHSLGGAAGLNAYLARYHITGFQLASDPLKSTASAERLALFYSALTQAPLVSPDDQRQIFALLVGANARATTYAPDSQIGSGALVVTTEQTAQGYTTIVAGQLRPASGPAVVIVAVSANQPTAAKTQAALQAFFKPLLTTIK
jgi:hypothetical protein